MRPLLKISFIALLHLLLLPAGRTQTWQVLGNSKDGLFHMLSESSFLVSNSLYEDIYKFQNGFLTRVYINDSGLNVINDISGNGNGAIFATIDMWNSSSMRLLKSTNQGTNWTTKMFPNMNGYHAIYFLNDSIGFLHGSKIYRTTDAGETWTLVSNVGGLYEMEFINDQEGFAVGGAWNFATKVRTFDGGRSWEPWLVPTGDNCEDVSFASACTGFITSSTDVVKWDRRTETTMQLDAPQGSGYNMVYFLNDVIGYLGVDTNMTGVPNFHDEALMYKTIDGGDTWTLQNGPYPISKPYEIQRVGNKLFMNCGNSGNETTPRMLFMTLPFNNLFSLSDSIVHPACNAVPDGQIIITPLHGEPPYQYTWSVDNLTSNHVSSLGPGTYTVSVEDADGYCVSQSFTLVGSTTLDATLRVRNATNFASNGSIVVDAVAGIPPYTYQWSHNAFLTSSTAIALPAGNYTVTIADAIGCETIHSAAVKQVSQIAGIPEFSIAINPFGQNTIAVRTVQDYTGELQFRLFSTTGSLVKSGFLDTSSDMHIQTNDLPAGLYFLQLTAQREIPVISPIFIAGK